MSREAHKAENFGSATTSAAFGGTRDVPRASTRCPPMTQCMVRPCVARSFVDLVFGLASMYPASDWSVFCSGPPWISARGRSHYRTGLDWAIWVTSVRSRREDRSPSRRYLSQTSAGKGLSAWLLLHRRLIISSVPWFVLTTVPSSRPDSRYATRAGTVKAGPPGPLAELGLDGAEHGARIMQVGSNH
jgi:hypothetical protein